MHEQMRDGGLISMRSNARSVGLLSDALADIAREFMRAELRAEACVSGFAAPVDQETLFPPRGGDIGRVQ